MTEGSPPDPTFDTPEGPRSRAVVSLLTSLPAASAARVARRAAPDLGQRPERVERLLAGKPGPITKPLEPRIARGVAEVLRRAGADVIVEGVAWENADEADATATDRPAENAAPGTDVAPGSTNGATERAVGGAPRDAARDAPEDVQAVAASEAAAEREAGAEAARRESEAVDGGPPSPADERPERPDRSERGIADGTTNEATDEATDGTTDEATDEDEAPRDLGGFEVAADVTDWGAADWRARDERADLTAAETSPEVEIAGDREAGSALHASDGPAPRAVGSAGDRSDHERDDDGRDDRGRDEVDAGSPPTGPDEVRDPIHDDDVPTWQRAPAPGAGANLAPAGSPFRRDAEVAPDDAGDPSEAADREPPGPPRDFDWGPSRWRTLRRAALLALLVVATAVLVFLQVNRAGPAAGRTVDYERGLAAYRSGDFATALDVWSQVATAGHPRALYMLGHMAEVGQGQPWSNRRAAGWYLQAAERGLPEAQLALGSLYERGLGVPPNAARAARWYRVAGEQGATEGQRRYAWMLLEGRGVPRDFGAALEWFERAAAGGSREAAAFVEFARWNAVR